MNIYIQTSDPKQNVRVTRTSVKLVPALHPSKFSVTNTLKTEAMQEAREVAHAEGLKLANIKRVAVTH